MTAKVAISNITISIARQKKAKKQYVKLSANTIKRKKVKQQIAVLLIAIAKVRRVNTHTNCMSKAKEIKCLHANEQKNIGKIIHTTQKL